MCCSEAFIKCFIVRQMGYFFLLMGKGIGLINNIGIKHGFLCINICWAPREMLKPEPERRGFRPLPRGPADVNVSEKHV